MSAIISRISGVPPLPDRRIYLLSARELSPETIAVAFAKTSRSPESFDEIAAGLTEEKSSRFHEKWVVGYGHASVAEHAVLHVAFENVSRLAIECIESNRLASYTEKSTRYQKWSADDFYVPAELKPGAELDQYVRVCRLLFDRYRRALEPVAAIVAARVPRRDGETDEALDRRLRSQYVDACRFLLPASALANVGMTANARVLESLIRKMLSHELAEVREIGEHVKGVARQETPTLVKYAEPVPYQVETGRALRGAGGDMGNAFPGPADAPACALLDYDPRGEEHVLAAALFRYGGFSYKEALQRIQKGSPELRADIAAALLGKLQEHDIPLRELELSGYTFELVMDQGAYVEFKRHRMMTQTPQLLTARLGYSVPRLMVEAGLGSDYASAMEAARLAYERLAEVNPHVAQYIVPNGFHRRVLARLNLREAFAFCELRSAPNAHFSIRRVANMVADEIRRVHPLLSKYMRLGSETAAGIAARHFSDLSD
jgi:thymidylate synthase ThyX